MPSRTTRRSRSACASCAITAWTRSGPYWHEVVGFNYRMTNLQAAIGVAQVKRIAAFVEKKREIARVVRRGARCARARGPHRAPAGGGVGAQRLLDELGAAGRHARVGRRRCARGSNDRGVDTRPFFHPAHAPAAVRDRPSVSRSPSGSASARPQPTVGHGPHARPDQPRRPHADRSNRECLTCPGAFLSRGRTLARTRFGP